MRNTFDTNIFNTTHSRGQGFESPRLRHDKIEDSEADASESFLCLADIHNGW